MWQNMLTIECLVRWTVIWRWCKGWLNRWRTSKLHFLNHVQLCISTIRMYNTVPLLLYSSTPGEQASLPEKGTGGGCESFAGQPEQAGNSCHKQPQSPIKPAIKANLNKQVVLVTNHLNHQANQLSKPTWTIKWFLSTTTSTTNQPNLTWTNSWFLSRHNHRVFDCSLGKITKL